MKLNLNYYQGNDKEYYNYEDEEKLIEKIKEGNYEKYLEDKDVSTEEVLALSNMRKNIINWYPFKENCNILEIDGGLGEITGQLCTAAESVTTLSFSKKRAETIAKRHEDRENLEIIVSTLETVEIEEKFDYITLIGLENILQICENTTLEKLLNDLHKYLKKDGKILLATDNKLAMKFFSKTNKTGIDIINSVGKKFFNFKQIKEAIKKANYSDFKMYYPMPDYYLTNVIFTNEKPLSRNNLNRNIIYNNEDTIKFYDENMVYRELLEENESNFQTFANSFFIEIFDGEYEENEIRLVAFSNMRKIQYGIKTIMKKDFIYKYSSTQKGKQHIDNVRKNIDIMNQSGIKTLDTYDEEKIISRYSSANTLDKVLIDLVKQNKREEVIELIKRFQEELDRKLVKTNSENNVFDKYNILYEEHEISDMIFIKDGLWDLIFQNCFYIDNEFYFYDQEWKEENIPIEFIFYRAIKYFARIKKYISEDELYKYMKINNKKINLFDKLDDKIQENIRNKTIWKLHTMGMNVMDLRRQQLANNHEMNLANIRNEENIIKIKEKDEELANKNREIENLQNQLNYVYNSKSWKITKPLRGIKKLGRMK